MCDIILFISIINGAIIKLIFYVQCLSNDSGRGWGIGSGSQLTLVCPVTSSSAVIAIITALLLGTRCAAEPSPALALTKHPCETWIIIPILKMRK